MDEKEYLDKLKTMKRVSKAKVNSNIEVQLIKNFDLYEMLVCLKSN